MGLSRPGIDPFTGRPVLSVRLIEVVDGGTPGVGVDVVRVLPGEFDAPPITTRPATLPPGGETSVVRPPLSPDEPPSPFFPDRPLGIDLVVTDARAPASKEDCKKGGYVALGFRNEGRCIASLNGGPKV